MIADRIALFDNDGTLWGEQPLYFQLFFAPDHPEWKTQEPFASLLKGEVKGALAGGEHAILEIVMVTHSGTRLWCAGYGRRHDWKFDEVC